MKRLILTVDGMMCPMCESHVNDAVRRVGNIKKVTASHKSGEVCVIGDAPDTDAIKAAIEAGGYKVLCEREEEYKKRGFFSSLFSKRG
ncbi:MAG: heavy-metal-associated domain-containing protein [Clostridia bacterium]|nr:heavy-metal-associated domain-containing protein [Clostridia bacterium]